MPQPYNLPHVVVFLNVDETNIEEQIKTSFMKMLSGRHTQVRINFPEETSNRVELDNSDKIPPESK